jgi:hypothetical protein
MKTFEQLGQAAFEAHQKVSVQEYPGYRAMAWDSMTTHEKAVFIAVAQQLWAEFAAIH